MSSICPVSIVLLLGYSSRRPGSRVQYPSNLYRQWSRLKDLSSLHRLNFRINHPFGLYSPGSRSPYFLGKHQSHFHGSVLLDTAYFLSHLRFKLFSIIRDKFVYCNESSIYQLGYTGYFFTLLYLNMLKL